MACEMITIQSQLIEDGIPAELLKKLIERRTADTARLNKLDDYYTGNHSILKRRKIGAGSPNNRVVNPFPKYITDVNCGYMFGNPIAYMSSTDDLELLQNAFKRADANTHDAELGKDLSVFGVAYELVYMSGDEKPTPRLALIDPRSAFVVYDETVERRPLLGVRFFPVHNLSGEVDKYIVNVYTATETAEYSMKNISATPVYSHSSPHYFGQVPLVEFWNNEEGLGDFEHVLSLIDAYNVLQSDRVNDKERFVDAILLVINAQLDLGTDEDNSAYDMLRRGILQMPGESDARYLVKMLNESEVEILCRAYRNDIHKFSHTPDFTDEHFAGNASGVAMSYKLLAMEYAAKTKERFFVEGLRKRLKLFSAAMELKGQPAVDTDQIDIVFNRQLPVNMLETAQIVNNLSGKVSNETLLTLLPFVKDIPNELENLAAEQSVKIKQEAGAFRTSDPGFLL